MLPRAGVKYRWLWLAGFYVPVRLVGQRPGSTHGPYLVGWSATRGRYQLLGYKLKLKLKDFSRRNLAGSRRQGLSACLTLHRGWLQQTGDDVEDEKAPWLGVCPLLCTLRPSLYYTEFSCPGSAPYLGICR